jgi:multidrug efflux pump subunit AcrA (membrane-fusion protein)
MNERFEHDANDMSTAAELGTDRLEATHAVLDDLDESNEQIRVVLGQVPNWFLSWGTTVIFCCLIIMAALSWYIKYPDVVTAEIVITTKNSPITVVSRTQGKLKPILVADRDQVQKGQVLAVIENTARHEDVYALLQATENLASVETSTLPAFTPKPFWRLGEVQESYQAFEKSYQDWRLYQQLTPQAKAIASLQKQMAEYSRLLEKQRNQQQLYEKELQLGSKIFERNKAAFARELISASELEQKQKDLVQAVRYRDDIKTQLSISTIRIEELHNSILNLTLEKQRVENEYHQTFISRLNALNTQISQWEETYVLKSPIAGKVTFFDFRSENQFVKSGEEVMTIVPGNEESLVGKVSMSLHNSGKVKDGNQVLVHLQNYPSREFGMLVGTVKNMALVPKNNTYAIEVEFHNSLKTTFNKTLEFRQELQGSAEIITEDLRLIERIFYQLVSLMNRPTPD